MSAESSPGAVAPSKPPFVWIGAGALALVSLAAAAAMVFRPGTPEPQMESLNPGKPVISAPSSTAPAKSAKSEASQAPRTAAPAQQTPVAKAVPKPAAKPAPEPVRVAAVCGYCGVVLSVDAVDRKGEGTGLGAIAGGVLGAAAGNQVGRGDGRKAMTVLGAVGGGLAGHEVEKRARGKTIYQVKIRFDDGSVRTLEQETAPKVGARVEVQGNTLKIAA